MFCLLVFNLCCLLLSSTNSSTSVNNDIKSKYEERTFNSSEIEGLDLMAGSADIEIIPSNDELSKIEFTKISDDTNVKIYIVEKVLKIESGNSTSSCCLFNHKKSNNHHVYYKIYIPKGIPISIHTGSSKINIAEMGDLDINAGSMHLQAMNISGIVNLNYASGEAKVRYTQIPPYPYSININTAAGKATFYLPPESKVKINAVKPNSVKSDFIHSLKCNFVFNFESASGSLRISKN